MKSMSVVFSLIHNGPTETQCACILQMYFCILCLGVGVLQVYVHVCVCVCVCVHFADSLLMHASVATILVRVLISGII